MNNILKISIITIITLVVLVFAGWYYFMNQVTSNINQKYQGKKIAVKALEKHGFNVSMRQASHYGFPYKMAWDIHGWTEESNKTQVEYLSPVKVGYDFLAGKLFISYSGDILAYFKPKQRGFGSRISVSDYRIIIDLPFSRELAMKLWETKDPFTLINHFDDITFSSNQVEIFDLVGNEKYYDKKFEKMHLKFTPEQQYDNLAEFLKNIPKKYEITYAVATDSSDQFRRFVPMTLLYHGLMVPSGSNVNLDLEIVTQGSSFNHFHEGLTMNSRIDAQMPFMDIKNMAINYNKAADALYVDQLKGSTEFYLKKGFFDYLIEKYQHMSQHERMKNFVTQWGGRINHVIENRELLKLHELEDSNYQLAIDSSSYTQGKAMFQKLNDLRLASDMSEIRLKHDLEYNFVQKHLKVKGDSYIRNYPTIVERISSYLYSTSKYRKLGKQAKKIYITANQDFVKRISDHPHSTSSDLSIEYDIDSKNYKKSKIGTVNMVELVPLYSMSLYQKLFDEIGYDGDLMEKVKEIFPNMGEKDSLLNNILSRISKKKDNSSGESNQSDENNQKADSIKQIFRNFIKP